MVYHFTKNIGIDVEADSLEQAMEFASDLDNYDYEIEDVIADLFEDGDFIDDIDSYEIHTGWTDYAGYTDDADEDDPEKKFYEHLAIDELTEKDEDNVRYVLTDKGRDYLAYCKGEYPEYDESNYDEHGHRINKGSEVSTLEKAIENAILSALAMALLG